MLAILLAMFVVLPSCKDDDKNDSGQDPNKQTDQDDIALVDNAETREKALTFWSIASQLIGADQYTDDYANATFEPIIGKEDGNTRIVATNTMAAAAQRFADLTGADIDESTATYTYSDPEVGTLTYTKVDDGTTLATVDVNIKQIPHLEKIIYQASSDENASFGNYKAWYRFGDVVKRINEGEDEYWICVRPAFTHEKKEDSHWICVNALPTKNIYEYHKDGKNYYLPTKVGTNKEHMQNFAELLYAIFCPEQWNDNIQRDRNGKMPIFHDFTYDKIDYHNQYFWANVQNAWKRNNVASYALNMSHDKIAEILNTQGVNLLYSGYSWWTWKGKCDLYQASYTNGDAQKEKNMHKADYTTVKKEVYEFSLDFRKMGKNIDDYQKFFDNDGKYRWVIRHATGKELNGGKQPSPTGAIQGVTDVYRYYSFYPNEWTKKDDKGTTGPEITENEDDKEYDEPKVGRVIGSNRKFYSTIKAAEDHNTDAIGMVVYVSRDGSEKNLAIALQDAGEATWSNEDYKDACNVSSFTDYTDDLKIGKVNSGSKDGDFLSAGCHKEHVHPAAEMAAEYKAFRGDATRWFLPSASDVLKTYPYTLIYDTHSFIVQNAEYTHMGAITKYYHNMFKNIDPSYDKSDVSDITFWTSTLYKDGTTYQPVCVSISLAGFTFVHVGDAPKYNDKRPVRPFMEF